MRGLFDILSVFLIVNYFVNAIVRNFIDYNSEQVGWPPFYFGSCQNKLKLKAVFSEINLIKTGFFLY